MTTFLSIRKNLYLVFSIATCAIMSNNSFGAVFEEREQLVRDLRPEIIAEHVRREFREHGACLNDIENRNIVAFLGKTNSGKSTLVNLLARKELRVVGQDYVLANERDEDAMPIGTGGNSKTLHPNFIQVGELFFFDIPGFNDTEGSVRDLVNGAFIKRILTRAKSVRFVFVAGQDEITAGKGALLKETFRNIIELFEGRENVMDNSIFVNTKSFCSSEQNAVEFLLGKISSEYRAWSEHQFNVWGNKERFCVMHHPHAQGISSIDATRERILAAIFGNTPPENSRDLVRDIDVSRVYPRETIDSLTRMFLPVMEEVLTNKIAIDPNIQLTLSKTIIESNDTDAKFWESFDRDLSRDDSVSLLKEFCIIPYNKSFEGFRAARQGIRQRYIQDLQAQRIRRTAEVERMTEARAQEVIAECIRTRGDVGVLDFGYHPYFYDQTCGAEFIGRLTIDPLEQEVVRRYYAGFISRHSQTQMERWRQRVIEPQFAASAQQHALQTQALTDQIAALTVQFREASARHDVLQRTTTQRLETTTREQRTITAQLAALEQLFVTHKHSYYHRDHTLAEDHCRQNPYTSHPIQSSNPGYT